MFKKLETLPIIDYELATTNRRTFARVIDLIVIGFIAPISAILLSPLTYASVDVYKAMDYLVVATIIFTAIIYETLFVFFFGKTIGKMIFGIRVVKAQGEKLGLGACLLRAILLYPTLIVLFAFLLISRLVGWMPEYVHFPHDRAVKSFVVREIKGKLISKDQQASKPAIKPHISDLDRLYEQGMISQEEFERKKKQTGL
jgi:uncharacterized RDD family membrane protein YckC